MGTFKHAIGNVLMIAINWHKISHSFAWSRVKTCWRFVNVDTLLSNNPSPLYSICPIIFLYFSFLSSPLFYPFASNSPFSIDESCSPNLSRSELWFPVLLSIFFIIFRVVYATELLVIDFLIKILSYILLSDRFKTLFKYYLCHHSLFTVQLPIIFSLHLLPQYCSGAINLFLGETATKFSKLE